MTAIETPVPRSRVARPLWSRWLPPALAVAPRRADPYAPAGAWLVLETTGAALLAILWILPLVYASWAAFHPSEFTTRFELLAPLTLENFVRAWNAAPFARYFLNTFLLVTLILACQLVLGTLAAYAFARYEFRGRNLAFALVLVQLMIMPDVLIVENYRTMSLLNIVDTIPAIALPYVASAFGIFLLRQTFKTVPKELDDAARVEGASGLQILLRIYVPLARPIYVAYGLVSVSYHWNNFLWPLIITNSVESRPLTVGLQVFSSSDQGIDWAIICAATLMTSGPLLIGFLLFQRQFVQSFMRAGIR
jgi:sn-glycerol 3-phosphate transport system permease protein